MTSDVLQHWAQKLDMWREMKRGKKETLLFIRNWRAHKTVNGRREKKLHFAFLFSHCCSRASRLNMTNSSWQSSWSCVIDTTWCCYPGLDCAVHMLKFLASTESLLWVCIADHFEGLFVVRSQLHNPFILDRRAYVYKRILFFSNSSYLVISTEFRDA